MEPLPGVTDRNILAWDGGDDDDFDDEEEWFIKGGWVDEEYVDYSLEWVRFCTFGSRYPTLGWGDWPYSYFTVLELFSRLDRVVKRPEHGDD